MNYNIYFGTVAGPLKVQYRYTVECKNDKEALREAYSGATSFYYNNEGTHHIPDFEKINQESEITGIDLEKLYKEHINDLLRWFAVPESLDTVPTKQLRYDYPLSTSSKG